MTASLKVGFHAMVAARFRVVMRKAREASGARAQVGRAVGSMEASWMTLNHC